MTSRPGGGRDRAGPHRRRAHALGLAAALLAGCGAAPPGRPGGVACLGGPALPARTAPASRPERPAAAAGQVRWVVSSAAGERLADRPALRWEAGGGGAADRVDVDDTRRYQVVRGVGGALTESSASLLAGLPADRRDAVMASLFGTADGAGLSVLRQPFGASDFALSDFTYADARSGDREQGLAGFSIDRDRRLVLPLLRQAAGLAPGLVVVGTAWSPPAWMKTGGTTHGGSLRPDAEAAYASYLACAVRQYRAAGVPVVAITPVNEPEHGTSRYPSTSMSAEQQAELVGAHLRPTLTAAGLADVAVLGYDHNWDDPGYPSRLLASRYATAFGGVAFHCYAGDPSAQRRVVGLAPDQAVWTTECSGGSFPGAGSGDLVREAQDVLVGAFGNGSVASLFWNLALDPDGGPRNGGCQTCRGLVTVDPRTGAVTRTTEFWVLAHLGRYVPPGSTRIASTGPAGGVGSVAFQRPDGTHVALLVNPAGDRRVDLRSAGRSVSVELPASSLTTLWW